MTAPSLPPAVRHHVDALGTPCAVLDGDRRTLMVNAAWRRAFPADGEVDGPAIDRLLSGLPGVNAVFASALGGQGSQRRISTVVSDGGATSDVMWAMTPWHTADGAVGGVLLDCDDVTAAQQTDGRHRDDAALVRMLFRHSPVGLNLCQTDGLWIESNAAFLEIIGYSAEEADGGLTYWDLTPRKYDDDEQVQLNSLQTTGRYGPYEKEFIRKDGSLVPVRLNGFFVERDGEQYIWSLIEDLTAQRALEARVEKERLAAIQSSKLATIGEMAAGFAHEINNPLSIIENYAFILSRLLDAPDRALSEEAITAIRDATHRAATIVGGLRKLSRDERGTEAAPASVRQLTEEAIDLCRFRFTNGGVHLTVESACDGHARIQPVEFQQVVVNLLNNAFDAVRHTDDGKVSVRCTDEEDRVVVAVEDSGRGLDAGSRERLFEPFFTTKAAGEGTGLGLSISRSIAEAAGGALSLDESAKHTRFVFALPRATEVA